MLKLLNIDRSVGAYLENAFNVSYEKQTNKIGSAKFSLPLDDPKVNKVDQLKYIEIIDNDGEYIGLYRIMPTETTVSESTQSINYELRHVLCLLIDSVIFGYKEISPNTSTKDTINALLSLQNTKHWRLGKCEFNRYFQYSWENVNGLVDAIWGIPLPFDEEYMWTYDTTSYPWTLNLIKPPIEPTCLVQEGFNLKGFRIKSNPNQLINRIYPLGQGDGVNKLKITKVNPTGKPYVEDAASIIENGIIEYIWSDKRFTDAYSLFSSAKALLRKWKDPIVSWEIDAADLIKAIAKNPRMKIPKIAELREGKVVRVKTNKFGTIDLRILKESKSDMFENPGDVSLAIGYVPSDLGTTQADTERKIEINELYSQGATNIFVYTFDREADSAIPVEYKFFVDDDVRHVNACELTVDTSHFRATSKGNTSSPQTVSSSTSSAGGASVQSATSSAGGASVQSATSSAGGSSTQTSSANGSHRHKMFTFEGVINYDWGLDNTANVFMGFNRNLPIYVGGSSQSGDLYTAEAADNHTHTVSVPAHSHNVSINIPAHTHNVSINIPAHTHQVSITIPGHTHEIIYGIFEYANLPSKLKIEVDGNTVPIDSTSFERFNIVPYLTKDEDGTATRGRHTLKITPNDLARIEVQLILRVFIQSQLGGEF